MFKDLMGLLEDEYDCIDYFTDGIRTMALVAFESKSVLIMDLETTVAVYYKFEEDFDLYDAQLIQLYSKRASHANAEIIRFLG